MLTELLIQLCDEELKGFLVGLEGKRKVDVFSELKTLVTIIRSVLRNGGGFLPLFVADKAEGDMIEHYLMLLSDKSSLFHLVLQEVKTIIHDYNLIRAVNFPEGESHRQIETKLYHQRPALGITGQRANRSNVATQFRMPGFPYVLITTDIFREGEDLHTFCQNVYHYGIAWNCSDMEQRIGRIDRINSMSHRKLSKSGAVQFGDQVHVFYPYLQNTLEVNQVNRLFTSINAFVETFNDFTEGVAEESRASTGEAIDSMPVVFRKPLQSRFEHHYFKGYVEKGALYKVNESMGVQGEELIHFLQGIEMAVSGIGSFYYGPELDKELFLIKGDMVLVGRKERRGPFRIQVKNTECPGRFKLEVASYLFKVSTRVQRELVEHVQGVKDKYHLSTIEDFNALSFEVEMEAFEEEEFIARLQHLVDMADSIEEVITHGDVNVFN